MTAIDYATGEVAHLTEAEARRLTERIRTALDRVSSAWADLAERITEAYQRRADLALGYGSWAEYAAAELKPSEGIAADVRRQLVGVLSAEGMSTRAIAPVVGVSDATAWRDSQVLHDEAPAPEPAAPERIDPVTGEAVPAPTFKPMDVTDWTDEELERLEAADALTIETWEATTIPAPEPRKVTGLDGKTYTRPEPKAPRRHPLPDTFADTLYDLDKRVASLARLVQDDRFPTNREAIRLRCLAQAKQTANTLAEVLAALETNSQEV